MRLKLWLPPNVWFHGSQSTSTGGVSFVNGQICASDCWFAHSIPCVLITPLGIAVEPEVKRILATLSGPTDSSASSTAIVGRGREELAEARRAVALGEHQLRAAEVDGRQHAAERPGVGRVHEPGLHERRDVLDLAVVLAHQRVRRGHGHDRHAGQEGAEREQRMVDRVAGQEQHRPLRAEAAVDQGLRDGVGLAPRFAPRQLDPRPRPGHARRGTRGRAPRAPNGAAAGRGSPRTARAPSPTSGSGCRLVQRGT